MSKSKTWQTCSFIELGSWLHLAAERAQRITRSKMVKENLDEAQFYLDQMQLKLNDVKENL